MRRWKTLMELMMQAQFMSRMFMTIAHYLKTPRSLFQAPRIMEKIVQKYKGGWPTARSPEAAFEPPGQRKKEIREMIEKQQTCTHMQLGKSTIDAKGSNDKVSMKTCRMCMKRWIWEGEAWVEKTNPKLAVKDEVRVMKTKPKASSSKSSRPPQRSSAAATASTAPWEVLTDQEEETSPYPAAAMTVDLAEQDSDTVSTISSLTSDY